MNAQSNPRSVGVDIGGTFTDAVLINEEGDVAITKVPTTPPDFAAGFANALDELLDTAGLEPSGVDHLVHGSTVATNALIEGGLARVGLVTTKGFRDVLSIGTQRRPSLYDLHEPKPPPLVPSDLRLEVSERVGADGAVVEPLSLEEVKQAGHRLAGLEVDAIAVVFLFSFLNRVHEVQARKILREILPDLPIALSSEISPELREFPRAVTTTINAGLLPVTGSYLRSLKAGLADRRMTAPLRIMQSNGGVIDPEVAAETPVRLVASGPAAGVIGATEIAKAVGEGDIISFDMGGTSADVSLVLDGAPQLRFRTEVEGLPMNVPQIDLLSVGAGGGSIATVDEFGSLRVGPESAGALPGPAAYGRGGELATVTDAHVVLGTIVSGRKLGREVEVDVEAARRAVLTYVGDPLELSEEEAARAILRMADNRMAGALRVVSVFRGQDPRALTLVAFGGAGPMHAASLAEEVGIKRVLIPLYPGVGSALGLLLSDSRVDASRSWIRPTESIEDQALRSILDTLTEEVHAALGVNGDSDAAGVRYELDMRCRGQAYELTVPLLRNGDRTDLPAAVGAFHQAHERAYGHPAPVSEVELVTVRAHGGYRHERPIFERGGAVASAEGSVGSREVTLDPEHVSWRIYQRELLRADSILQGPCLVEQEDTTVVIPGHWRGSLAAWGTLVLDWSGP